jgi:hypothetical protein
MARRAIHHGLFSWFAEVRRIAPNVIDQPRLQSARLVRSRSRDGCRRWLWRLVGLFRFKIVAKKKFHYDTGQKSEHRRMERETEPVESRLRGERTNTDAKDHDFLLKESRYGLSAKAV